MYVFALTTAVANSASRRFFKFGAALGFTLFAGLFLGVTVRDFFFFTEALSKQVGQLLRSQTLSLYCFTSLETSPRDPCGYS